MLYEGNLELMTLGHLCDFSFE